MKADELRDEYDFSSMPGRMRGKYVDRYQRGTNVVHLDPDVAAVFPSDASVNEALRSLIRIARAETVPEKDRIDLSSRGE